MKDFKFINNEGHIKMTHTCLIASHHHLHNNCINWKKWMANPYHPHPLPSAAWFMQVTDSNVHLQCLSDKLLPSSLTHLPQHLQ